MNDRPSNIDVISVTGLFVTTEYDGTGKTIKEGLNPRSIFTINPTPPDKVGEDPETIIAWTVAAIRQRIRELKDQFGEVRVVLVGHSYGALMAIMAASRMQFEDIVKVIVIEGPLNPDVEVSPPTLLPHLRLCGTHYKARPGLCREAEAVLGTLGTSKVVIIRNTNDSVVPPEAQELAGDFQKVELHDEHDLTSLESLDNSRGVIVTLPPHIGGTSGGLKSVLPPGYRNHLFWSAEKKALINAIVAAVTADHPRSSRRTSASRSEAQM